MKNKDRYNLTELMIKPKYMTTGCGAKVKSIFWFDVIYKGEKIAKDIEAKENLFLYFMRWLEEEEKVNDNM